MNPDDLKQERDQSRQIMLDAWSKHQNNEPLEALEQQIVTLIKEHPEYQAAFEQTEHLAIDYPMDPTINPFLHIGLHLTIHEQITIDQPAGIRELYQALCQQIGSVHETEHLMMQVLATALDIALYDPTIHPEQQYLAGLRDLLK